MAQILGIGNLVLDIVLHLKDYPQEDSEQRAQRRIYQAGGNTANLLYVLSQLGHDTSLVSTVATDDSAKQLTKILEERKIQTEHFKRHIQGSTPTSYIWLTNGKRTISHHRDLPEVDFEHFAKIEIEAYDWLHFEGRNLDHLPGMLNIAKTFLTTQPISLEVEKPHAGIEALFPQANLIMFSQPFAEAKGYENPEDFLQAMHQLAPQAQLSLTWGDQGAWYLDASGKIGHQPAVKLNRVIDTLGAGDTYNAALIHNLIEGAPLPKAIEAATQLAAKKCQQLGFDDLLAETQRKPIANERHITNSRATVVPAPGLEHRVVLIKHEDEIKAYENNCPHQDVPLDDAYKIDINPFEQTMKCSVHDAYFRIEDGVCIEGPCFREELIEVPIEIDKETGSIYIKE